MQCKDYSSSKVVYPVYGQVKMNGIFGRWNPEEACFFTRSNERIRGLSKLVSEVQGQDSFDCELVIPGIDFFTMNGLIRSFNETPACVAYVFDLPLPRVTTGVRLSEYTKRFTNPQLPHVVPLKYHCLKNRAEVDTFYDKVLKAGHEGIVIKTISANYYDGKKYFVQKRVPMFTTECVILDIIEGRKGFVGMMGAFLVAFNDTTLKVGMGQGVDFLYREHVWENKEKFIGKTLKVGYKSITPQGSLQSPKILGVRWDI